MVERANFLIENQGEKTGVDSSATIVTRGSGEKMVEVVMQLE